MSQVARRMRDAWGLKAVASSNYCKQEGVDKDVVFLGFSEEKRKKENTHTRRLLTLDS